MLADAFRHAQLVYIEHANQVIARIGRTYHRLCREHRSKSPHVGTLLDLGEARWIIRVAWLDAMHYGRRKLRAHEADLGGGPCGNIIGVASAAHADVGTAITFAQYH